MRHALITFCSMLQEIEEVTIGNDTGLLLILCCFLACFLFCDIFLKLNLPMKCFGRNYLKSLKLLVWVLFYILLNQSYSLLMFESNGWLAFYIFLRFSFCLVPEKLHFPLGKGNNFSFLIDMPVDVIMLEMCFGIVRVQFLVIVN